MDRYQKTPAKQRQKRLENGQLKGRLQQTTHGALKNGLGAWQNKLDNSIDQYIRRDLDDVEIMLVPDDLHTCDPSLLGEILSGHFGLDGMFVEVGEGHPSVFAAPYADDSFNRVLHGFSWLRDLGAAQDHQAQQEAQRLVFEWTDTLSQHEGIAYEPLVIASRVSSFISNSPLILRSIGQKKVWRFLRILSQQIAVLHFKLGETPLGLSRLRALAALVMAGLCLSKQTKLLAQVTPLFIEQLEEQILKDGGHISRNPDALLAILFEILPLKRCFKGRGQDVPAELDQAIWRMLPMIRFFRLGDSSLVRFNGATTTPTDALATLLAYDEQNRPFDAYARDSGYCRVQDGPVTVLCDIGAPPLRDDARQAHAGCLSFEMSVRHFALVVNSGAYHGEDEHWRRYARSTMAHSTLSLDDHSSGGFAADGRLVGPYDINVERADLSGLEATHRGYEKQFGFLHRRSLSLSHDGLRLVGVDNLEGVGLTSELAFAIRLHLHPLIEVAQSDEDNLLLTLPDGEIWRFTAKGAPIALEDSIYLAYRRGPEPAHQITLIGSARAGTKVTWLFEQYRQRPDAP